MDRLKHIVGYGLLLVSLALLARQWVAERDAKKDLLAQTAVQKQAADDLVVIEKARREGSDALAKLAAERPTVQTVTKLLPFPLAGKLQLEPVSGETKITLDGDPQANLRALQAGEVRCAQDSIDLKAFKDKLDVYDNDIVPSLKRQRDDMAALAAPKWTLIAGLSKDSPGMYKPGVLLSYSLTKDFGVTAGAVNNAVFLGVDIRFGKVGVK